MKLLMIEVIEAIKSSCRYNVPAIYRAKNIDVDA